MVSTTKSHNESESIFSKIAIYAVSFTWAAGRSVIFTFLGYFGIILGASPFEQGILTSVRNLGANIFQSFWGYLVDLKGRKIVMLLGLLTLCLSSFVLLFITNTFHLVIIALILTSIGFSFIPAWNAFLGDYSSETTRGTYIGKVNSFGTFTALITIFIMGILMDTLAASLQIPFPAETIHESTRVVFSIPFLGGTFIFLLAIVVALFLKERYKAKDRLILQAEHQLSWSTLIARNPPFKRLLPINTFFKFAMSVAWPIFPFVTLKLADSWLMVSLMWILFNLPRAVSQNIGGKLSDLYNRKGVLIFARLSYAIVPLGYAIGLALDNPWLIFIVHIPAGMSLGSEETAISAYALDCSTETTKGRYYSLLLTFAGISAFIGSLAAGATMELMLELSNITYENPAFDSILIILLLVITALRIIGGLFHKFIYNKPQDFPLEDLLGKEKNKNLN